MTFFDWVLCALAGVWLASAVPFLLNGLDVRRRREEWGFDPPGRSRLGLALTALALGPLALAAWLRRGTAYGRARRAVLAAASSAAPGPRARTCALWGLAAAALAAAFWGLWSLWAPVPEAASLDLWPSPGETALPFALSRWLDVPAALAWGSLLAWLGTSPPVRRAFWKESDLYGGLACGLASGLASGLAGGLFCGLTVGLVCGLVCGLVSGLSTGLGGGLDWGLAGCLACGLVCGLACVLTTGLAFSLACGLLPALPIALMAVPALIGLFRRAERAESRRKS